MTKEIDSKREFYEAAKPEAVRKYFEDGLYKVAIREARSGIVPPPDIISFEPKELSTDEDVAQMLAGIEVDDPHFQKLDVSTDEGKLDATVLTMAKSKAAAEQNPRIKGVLQKFEDKVLSGMVDFFEGPPNPARKAFLKAAPVVALALVTASCGPNVIVPPAVIPGDGGAGATAAEVSPTAIPSATQTEAPTATATVEAPAFMPEGFSEGPMGLLRSPETGKDVIGLNPEADWKSIREQIINNLWQANHDWTKFTGQGNEASHMTKEDFLKKALAGEELTFGIPVRADTTGLYPGSTHPYLNYVGDLKMKSVTARLDNIQLQALTGSEFIKYTGGDFTSTNQESWEPIRTPERAPYNNAVNFTVNNGQLVISVGSFYVGDKVSADIPFLVGDFNPAMAQKYKSYFRPDGIGVEADHALTEFLHIGLAQLKFFPAGEYNYKFPNGPNVKFISTFQITNTVIVVSEDLKPPLFIFSQ